MSSIKYNEFFIDLFNILPESVTCFIQAPSLENNIIKNMLQDSEYDYYKLVTINSVNKEKFISQEIETSFSMYIQKIEIKQNNVLLFEGFDGIEFGIISKTVILPDWFKIKYISDVCTISKEW